MVAHASLCVLHDIAVDEKTLICIDSWFSFKKSPDDLNVIGVRCSFDTGGSLEDQITLAVTLKHFYYD